MWEEYNKTTRLMVPDEHLVRFVKKTFTDSRQIGETRILDAGFASGRHLVYLARLGFDVYGFDSSEESLKFAGKWLGREKLSAKISRADMLQLPYDSGYFDVFVEIGMIEHFLEADRKKAIAEAYRVLKPGGYFFLNVKKYGDYLEGSGPELEANTYLINESFIENTPYHFFRQGELKRLLRDFRDMDLNYAIMTRNNMGIKIHNWVVVARK